MEEAEPEGLIEIARRDPFMRSALITMVVTSQDYVDEGLRDLRLVGRRLIGKEQEVYAEKDRSATM